MKRVVAEHGANRDLGELIHVVKLQDASVATAKNCLLDCGDEAIGFA